MSKYLIQGSYTEAGVKGLLKEGGSGRRAAVDQLATSIGGKVESFYYTFGLDDFAVVVDVPSHVDAVALSLAANASGALKARLTPLITIEEMDQATKKTVNYRAPGK